MSTVAKTTQISRTAGHGLTRVQVLQAGGMRRTKLHQRAKHRSRAKLWKPGPVPEPNCSTRRVLFFESPEMVETAQGCPRKNISRVQRGLAVFARVSVPKAHCRLGFSHLWARLTVTMLQAQKGSLLMEGNFPQPGNA